MKNHAIYSPGFFVLMCIKLSYRTGMTQKTNKPAIQNACMQPGFNTTAVRELSGFGVHLKKLRKYRDMTQGEVATSAQLSLGYYCTIENGKRQPPPRQTLMRILHALRADEKTNQHLVHLAAQQRGISPADENLSEDVQQLMAEIRLYANKMRPQFLRGLRAKIREAFK